MKKLLILLMIGSFAFFASSCEDEWGNNNSAMEHIYYYGFQDWGGYNNNVKFNVKQGETVAIPTQFWSEFTRSYTPKVYYYTTPTGSGAQLVCGTDYQVVDEAGNALTPDENGAYTMEWPNAVKGIQNIYIKALNGQTGSILVHTFDPNKEMSNMDVESTTIIKTDEYEVRAFTENHYVTVNIQ